MSDVVAQAPEEVADTYVPGMAHVTALAKRGDSRRAGDRFRETLKTVPVVLVGCCGKKLNYPAPARELYQSPLFKWARRYAEARKLPWAILSAKHGLVLPAQFLEPYDMGAMALRAQGMERLREWGELVRLQRDFYFPKARFVFLAGSDYRGAIEDLKTKRITEPLAGLGIGRRLNWLRREAFEPVAVTATKERS